jgi:putative ABC transport system ATP-binding protein
VSLIALNKIVKQYHLGDKPQTVLHDIDLSINAGESVAIIGASGSGKSTLMNMLGLLDRPTSGAYLLKDKPVADLSDDDLAHLRNQQFGFVFQQFYLLSRLSAAQNVALPLSYAPNKTVDGDQIVMELLEKVGMQAHAHHKPTQLSGGQQQRVAIARALVNAPDIILADEPTGALDSQTGDDIMQLFLQLNEAANKTLIIVTHDPNVANRCKRIVELKDGRIISDKGTGSAA